MAMIVVERTGPGEWRYGTEVDGTTAWSGVARRSPDHAGVDLEGPWDLDPTVRLLISLEPDAEVIRFDPEEVWRAAGELYRAAQGQARAPAGGWKRATAGDAEGTGRSLSEMARSGRMGV